MQKLVKLFVLAVCLIVVGTAFAGKVKGPDARLIGKNGTVMTAVEAADPNFRLPEAGSRRPGSLDEVIISEDFDALTPGTLPEGWIMVDVDNSNCSDANWPFDQSEWTTLGAPFPAHSGTNTVANVYNDGAVPNNDWLILPQQNLTGEITLTFWAASQQTPYLETFAVKVSTTGTNPADFTNTIQTFNAIPITWTEHTLDLSAYAGAPFYVAFHHTSVDMWVIKIDDILLEAGEAAPTGTIAGTVTEFGTGTPLNGVAVEIEGGASTTTDANGEYTLTAQAGTYTLNFSKQNYEDEVAAGVEVVVEQTTTVDVEMVPSSTVVSNYPSAATPVAIPDDNETGATKTLTITDDFLIEDVDITVNITHTWITDLSIWITSPEGEEVQLAQEPEGAPNTGQNMTNCRFDDEAETAFDYVSGAAPYTGSWQPVEQLGIFEGFSSMGTWTLRAADFEGADTGTIGIFIVHIEHEAGSATGDPATVPSEFAMNAAYPNPFNPTTRIDFEVPVTTNGELKIFNSLGQEVTTLVQGNLNAGVHSVYFDGAALTSGIYFAQLRAGSFVSTQKLVLMK
jgi:subtilisin-like proprotein convertase family protein